MTRAAAIAISHGGGPLPLLGDPSHEHIVESLRHRVPQLLRLGTPEAPRAIVLVTAHWSERHPTVSNGAKHRLLYDYYGFPPETYKLKYDAPGSPEVAQEVVEVLQAAGLKPATDDERGWDHGVFVPMLMINPSANTPIVQVSVLDSESPSDHFAMGLALSKLRDSNIAVVGSGFATFHNIRGFTSGITREPAFRAKSDAFSEAVSTAMAEPHMQKRAELIKNWRAWPNSYEMHPRGGAEHFLPLLVCAGAGRDQPSESYSDAFLGLDIVTYYWK